MHMELKQRFILPMSVATIIRTNHWTDYTTKGRREYVFPSLSLILPLP
jgi:hypothetical protein